MDEPSTGTKREAISFFPNQTNLIQTSKILEIKFTLAGITFKAQLAVFKERMLKELLYSIQEFSQAKSKLGPTTYLKLESGLESHLWYGRLLLALSIYCLKSICQPNEKTDEVMLVLREGK